MSRRARPAPAAAALALALGLAAAAAPAEEPPAAPGAVLDARFGDRRTTVSIESLLAEGLPAGEAFRVRELGRDAGTSHHLVWIREAEEPHRHERHDLVVVLLRGFGTMRLGDEERAVGPGSILYVPRGAVHAFRNASGAPAAAYAVYAPAFDGRDRVAADASGAAAGEAR